MVKKKSNKIGKQDILDRFLTQNDKLIEYISRIDKTLEVLNDQNTLHIKSLEDNKTAIENSSNVNKTVTRLFAFLLILQAAAIIVLAGAEKVLQYFNFKVLPTP